MCEEAIIGLSVKHVCKAAIDVREGGFFILVLLLKKLPVKSKENPQGVFPWMAECSGKSHWIPRPGFREIHPGLLSGSLIKTLANGIEEDAVWTLAADGLLTSTTGSRAADDPFSHLGAAAWAAGCHRVTSAKLQPSLTRRQQQSRRSCGSHRAHHQAQV